MPVLSGEEEGQHLGVRSFLSRISRHRLEATALTHQATLNPPRVLKTSFASSHVSSFT